MTDEPVSRSRYLREKSAREQAENLLEQKSIELFKVNQNLISLNSTLEQKVRQRTEELENATRAREDFLACMSHELRTPLNAIIGFSETINKEIFGSIGNPQYQEYVQLIHKSGQHLLSLINDLLNFTKINSGEYEIFKEPLDVTISIENAISFLQQMADEKNISLNYRISKKSNSLNADHRVLLQMLLNLLSNAIKYTNKGGKVSILHSVGKREIRISILDSGIGIAREDLDKVLQPFGQAHSGYVITNNNQSGSTGLGLSIVNSLMELHEGRFSLYSQLGRGSRATLHFPM